MSPSLDELREGVLSLHGQIARLLMGSETHLRATLVPDHWNVLDVIGHINGWGLIFLGDMRYMARHPGRDLPYRLYTRTDYDDENEALVARRGEWSLEQYAKENYDLSAALVELIDSFDGEMPTEPVAQPWQGLYDIAKRYDIAGVLEYHVRHGLQHVKDVQSALARSGAKIVRKGARRVL
jgi:hypothetical protein